MADSLSLAKEVASRASSGDAKRPAEQLTANLRVGVIGALSVRGGLAAGWRLPRNAPDAGIDWGNAHRL
jgi:hypothetical protein